jgi:hypothetical protein
MGRKSREHRERRERRAQARQSDRSWQLEEELKSMKDGDAVFGTSKDCPPGLRDSHLEDILAFESVEPGTSLFDGLQQHGIELPRPETLDEEQSATKIKQVLRALSELQIILVGYEQMSARKFYRTLWTQTLWEGCYVQKRTPGAVTIMDVSHSMPKSEVMAILEDLAKSTSVH